MSEPEVVGESDARIVKWCKQKAADVLRGGFELRLNEVPLSDLPRIKKTMRMLMDHIESWDGRQPQTKLMGEEDLP